MDNLNELEELVQPIFDWLQKNDNPYTEVIIDLEGVKVRVTEEYCNAAFKE